MTYAATRGRVDDMLARKGQAVTLTRRTSGAYNPATGAAVVATASDIAMGVILPLAAGIRHMAGSNIADGDQQLLLSAIDTAGDAIDPPGVDDTVDASGKVHTVIEVNTLGPDGTALIYDCVVRASQ